MPPLSRWSPRPAHRTSPYFRNLIAFPGFSDPYYATEDAGWQREPIAEGVTNGSFGVATSIALTELATPSVSYTRSTSLLRYAIRTGGSWSDTQTAAGAGGYSSLVWRGTQADPTPVIAYYDVSAGDLEVANLGVAWSSSVLDSSGDSGTYCALAQRNNYLGIAYINAGKLGYFESVNGGSDWGVEPSTAFPPFSDVNAANCALAIAESRNGGPAPSSAHILYFDSNTSQYSYITNDTDTGVWITPQVVFTSTANTIIYPGCSIAIGTDGTVHVAFLDYTTRQLKYATRISSGWSAVQTPDVATGGAFCSLKLTAANQPRIAYAALPTGMNPSPTALRFAAFQPLVPPPTPTPPSNPSPTPDPASPSATPTPEPVPPTARDFTVRGKKKRTTEGRTSRLKGTATASVIKVEWRVGKKRFRSAPVSNGRWTVRVRPLKVGLNKAQIRGVDRDGLATPTKIIRIRRF